MRESPSSTDRGASHRHWCGDTTPGRYQEPFTATSSTLHCKRVVPFLNPARSQRARRSTDPSRRSAAPPSRLILVIIKNWDHTKESARSLGMDQGESQVLLGSHCRFHHRPFEVRNRVPDRPLTGLPRSLREYLGCHPESGPRHVRRHHSSDSDDHRCHQGRHRLGKAAIDWFKRWLSDTSKCSRSTVPRIVKRSVEYRQQDSQ